MSMSTTPSTIIPSQTPTLPPAAAATVSASASASASSSSSLSTSSLRTSTSMSILPTFACGPGWDATKRAVTGEPISGAAVSTSSSSSSSSSSAALVQPTPATMMSSPPVMTESSAAAAATVIEPSPLCLSQPPVPLSSLVGVLGIIDKDVMFPFPISDLATGSSSSSSSSSSAVSSSALSSPSSSSVAASSAGATISAADWKETWVDDVHDPSIDVMPDTRDVEFSLGYLGIELTTATSADQQVSVLKRELRNEMYPPLRKMQEAMAILRQREEADTNIGPAKAKARYDARLWLVTSIARDVPVCDGHGKMDLQLFLSRFFTRVEERPALFELYLQSGSTRSPSQLLAFVQAQCLPAQYNGVEEGATILASMLQARCAPAGVSPETIVKVSEHIATKLEKFKPSQQIINLLTAYSIGSMLPAQRMALDEDKNMAVFNTHDLLQYAETIAEEQPPNQHVVDMGLFYGDVWAHTKLADLLFTYARSQKQLEQLCVLLAKTKEGADDAARRLLADDAQAIFDAVLCQHHFDMEHDKKRASDGAHAHLRHFCALLFVACQYNVNGVIRFFTGLEFAAKGPATLLHGSLKADIEHGVAELVKGGFGAEADILERLHNVLFAEGAPTAVPLGVPKKPRKPKGDVAAVKKPRKPSKKKEKKPHKPEAKEEKKAKKDKEDSVDDVPPSEAPSSSSSSAAAAQAATERKSSLRSMSSSALTSSLYAVAPVANPLAFGSAASSSANSAFTSASLSSFAASSASSSSSSTSSTIAQLLSTAVGAIASSSSSLSSSSSSASAKSAALECPGSPEILTTEEEEERDRRLMLPLSQKASASAPEEPASQKAATGDVLLGSPDLEKELEAAMSTASSSSASATSVLSIPFNMPPLEHDGKEAKVDEPEAKKTRKRKEQEEESDSDATESESDDEVQVVCKPAPKAREPRAAAIAANRIMSSSASSSSSSSAASSSSTPKEKRKKKKKKRARTTTAHAVPEAKAKAAPVADPAFDRLAVRMGTGVEATKKKPIEVDPDDIITIDDDDDDDKPLLDAPTLPKIAETVEEFYVRTHKGAKPFGELSAAEKADITKAYNSRKL